MAKEKTESKGIIEGITSFAERYVPDSYVILLILTVIAFILALALTPSSPYKVVQSWGQGFWVLLEFSMQMALIVVTGYALATTPFVNRILGQSGNAQQDNLQYGFSDYERNYIDQRARSQAQARISQYLLDVLLVNHIVSAIDAVFSATAYNDRLLNKESIFIHLHLREQLVNTGNETVFGYALCLRF